MKKVLMIATYNFLTKHDDGGRQVSYNNYEILCKVFGKKNVFLCIITNDKLKQNENLFTVPACSSTIMQVFNAILLRNGYSKKTQKKLINYMENNVFDFIWFDRSTIGGLLRKIRTSASKVVFFHNVERNYILNKILHDNICYAVSYFSFAWNEKQAIKRADRIICLNNRDSELLNIYYARKADFLLPVSFEDVVKYDKYGKEDKKGTENKLLFVGSYFAPNIKGIEWFIEKVLPYLSNTELTIVGKGMERKRKDWENDKTHVLGTVEELNQYYADADAVVLPIPFGDGMKVKTAEALMYGKVIFATEEALIGYDIEQSSDVYKCNSDIEFIEKINDYFKIRRQTRFSINNRKLFLEKYENEAVVQQVFRFFMDDK